MTVPGCIVEKEGNEVPCHVPQSGRLCDQEVSARSCPSIGEIGLKITLMQGCHCKTFATVRERHGSGRGSPLQDAGLGKGSLGGFQLEDDI